MTHEEFRQARARMGLSQHELAQAMKVDDRTVRRWEKGERPIPGPVEVLTGFLVKLLSGGAQ